MTNVAFGLPQILSSFLMIIVCCCTDCAAATALAYEEPEADVLTRPPRNAKKDRLRTKIPGQSTDEFALGDEVIRGRRSDTAYYL